MVSSGIPRASRVLIGFAKMKPLLALALLVVASAGGVPACHSSALDVGVTPRITTPEPGTLLAPHDLPKNFDWRNGRPRAN